MTEFFFYFFKKVQIDQLESVLTRDLKNKSDTNVSQLWIKRYTI